MEFLPLNPASRKMMNRLGNAGENKDFDPLMVLPVDQKLEFIRTLVLPEL